MKRLLILVLVVLVLLAAVGPVFADSDEHANHPDHIPGFDNNNGDGNIANLPIPPGWAEADPPGPNDP